MKIALYVEDGLEQIVLTPQTDTEKSILGKLHEGQPRIFEIKRGSFYECRGGWMRHPHEDADDESTMIVMRQSKTLNEQ